MKGRLDLPPVHDTRMRISGSADGGKPAPAHQDNVMMRGPTLLMDALRGRTLDPLPLRPARQFLLSIH